MRYKLIVTEDAENDTGQAMDFYESKQKGLGKRYLMTVRASLKLIVKNPFSYMKILLEIRKANTQKFPYSLYYTIEESEKTVVVFAVIHCSRSDKAWKKRIKK